jgi:1-acyl-sn-glycerol-3-phosphate acyltransferase
LTIRKILRIVLYFLFRTLTRLHVAGQENIPASGGCIVAGNHLGILDGPLIYCLLTRPDATALAADTHKRNPLYRWIVDLAGGIWIDRTTADFHALKQARDYLKKGGLLGMAPEGTRSPTHQLIRGKPGVAFLASSAGNIPIVPLAVTGTEKIVEQLLRFRRPLITVQFGEAFTLPPVDRKDKDASLQRNTDEIMCRIAAMLPPHYRGVYADCPNLN